jgi:ribose transport system permease protein
VAAEHSLEGLSVRSRLAAADFVDLTRRYGIIVVWLGVIAVFSALRPNTFFTLGNLQTIAGSQAVLVVLTLGLLVPFAVGEFDVSVSGTLGISLVLVGYLNVLEHWAIGWAILSALGVGLLVGAVNAFFVVVARVESIVVTLGMGTLLVGVAVGINDQSTGGISQNLVDAMRNQLFGIPLAFYYGLALTVVVWYVMSHTPLGRYLYFVGSGRDVARLSGVRVEPLRAGAFLASALAAAFAGVVLAGWLSASDVTVSSSYMLSSFAAAFLGASIIHPGRFNAWGTLIAVYFLVTGITGLELLGLAGWIESVFYGSSLVIAVAITRTISLRGADS